jgi:hypothetical protein
MARSDQQWQKVVSVALTTDLQGSVHQKCNDGGVDAAAEDLDDRADVRQMIASVA